MTAVGPRWAEDLARLQLPAGLPPLRGHLRLGVATTDGPGVVLDVDPAWRVTVDALAAGEVYDGAVVAPAALVRSVLAGERDVGFLAVEGTFTGTLASQSALALLFECAASGRMA